MKTYNIKLPLKDYDIHDFRVGDIIYLSGTIGTGRDHVHKRILDYQNSDRILPDSFSFFNKGAIYHMGPIVKKNEKNKYQIVSGGPTTSARMEPYQEEVCQTLGVSFVIGKGGMFNINWNRINAIYLSFPGGVGALMSKFIKKIVNIEWLDLGTPEAVWFFEVNKFGPLIVTADTHNQNLYQRKLK